MRKLIFTLIFLSLVLPLFAQQISPELESNMYYINVPVEKVLLSGKGYLIQYQTSTNMIGTVGIPYEWFTNAAANAELINLPPGKSWPTMSIFYREGEFSHVRLYVHRNKGHSTWSVTPQGADVSRYFQDAESFTFKY